MNNVSALPIQKLPMSKKNKEWGESNIKYWIGKYKSDLSKYEEIKVCEDLYDSIYNEKDIQYVTNPFKVQEGFPASPHNFNIIKPKIDLLIGEMSKRMDSFKVFHTSEEAVSRIQEKKVQVLKDYISSYVMQEGFDQEEEEKRLMEIEDYFKGSYVDEAEEAAYHSLNYLKEKLNLDFTTLKGFEKGLITGKEIYYCGIVNGEPYVEKVNPRYFAYDENPDLENIEEGEWSVYRIPMTIPGIHDRLGDLMTESQFDDLVKRHCAPALSNKASDVNYSPIVRSAPSWFIGDSSTPENTIDVYHVTWRSFKKIGFLNILDEETGETETITVDENYTALPTDDIEWEWITEIWEGYYIDDDLYVGIQPIENQEFSVDSPNNNKLPYIGSVYGNKSLVSLMKPLQYMYIIVWYRLELMLARDKGKVMLMDITQIPKSMGIDVPEFMHYLSSMGVAFVNPYEEGWDIPGREGGKPAAMNQFNAMDLTMGNVLAEYISLLAKIEDMIGEISGVSRQRLGQVENRETKGGVERAVVNSSHVTELYFYTHNNIKKRLYNYLLNCAKIAWSRSDKKKLYYIMDDSNRAFIDLNDEFLYSDFGVFVTDSTRENNNIEAIKSLLQPAMQSGATLLDAAYILTSSNMSMIKSRLKDVEARRQDAERKQSEMQQQLAVETKELQMEQLRLNEEDSIRKAETSIQVALIQAGSNSDETDNAPSSLDIEKLQLDKEKAKNDYEIKKSKIEEDKRKNKSNESLKEKQLKIQSSKTNKTSK
ncbi:MAG: hypothetical protein WC346_12920 [Methanogenium sp.]|jgi:hypothetical protein